MNISNLNRAIASCTAAFILAAAGGCDSESTAPELKEVEHVSILVSLDEVTLEVGESVTILASPVTDEGQPRTMKLVWESTNDQVAKVTAQGTVTAVAPGFARLEVRAVTHAPNQIVEREEVVIHVLEDAASVSIEPAGPVEMVPGDTLALTAIVRSGSGEILERQVMWYAGDLGVASVDDQGLVRAVSAGETLVTAEACDLVTASVRVVVKEP